jgi:hypothetical protein
MEVQDDPNRGLKEIIRLFEAQMKHERWKKHLRMTSGLPRIWLLNARAEFNMHALLWALRSGQHWLLCSPKTPEPGSVSESSSELSTVPSS